MIDHTHLNSLTQLLGKNVINQIRLEYIEDSTQKVAQLKSAWDEKDYQTLQAISHSLKSASLNMAMNMFAAQCGQIEESASQHSDSGIRDMINSLHTTHSKSLKELEAYFIE